MLKYDVLKESSLESLVARVNEAAKHGWKAVGGIAVDRLTVNCGVTYLQAIIKE